ncbi:MAG: hypothetical protein ACE5GU_04215 [Candidatus Scalinduaceae bacterium]
MTLHLEEDPTPVDFYLLIIAMGMLMIKKPEKILLGGLDIETTFHRPELPVSRADEEHISKFLDTNINNSLPIIIVHPCASGLVPISNGLFQIMPCWPIRYWRVMRLMLFFHGGLVRLM